MDNHNIADKILKWFDREKRTLPWRGVNDAYKTWLSEVMLQQTTVKTVKPYYERFITLWPNLEALAKAPLDDILREWAGLGYYSRARNLHACAIEVWNNHGGIFPVSSSTLLKLTGIGAYTAASIASIAHNEQIAVVDGNVERVWGRVKRLHGVEAVRQSLQDYVPESRPGDFAECLMDIGATLCTPKNPACGLCPLQEVCQARLTGAIADYPLKKQKAKLPERRGLCFIIENEGKILVETRPDKGLLGGMSGLPCSSWVPVDEFNPHEAIKETPLTGDFLIKNDVIRHVFTHFALELTPVIIRTKETGRFVDPLNNNEPFPVLFKKVLATYIP